MTERNDIIDDGTDGLEVSAAGSSQGSGRTTHDPAEAETVSGSAFSPPAPSGAGGEDISAGEEPVDSGATGEAGFSDRASEAGFDGGGDEVSEEIDELAAAVSERDEYKDLALRAKADFENYRKRADKKVAEARANGVAGVLRELMPVIDNLDRAVEVAGTGADGDSFAEGVRLVHADLHSVLDRLGLVAIDPAGEVFDPSLHEAISQAPAGDVAANTIVEVVQKGFMLGETVVRPARVVVAA